MLLQANTSSIVQLSSPLQIHQRYENSFDDCHKASLSSSNEVKPLISSVGHTSVTPTGDASGSQKVCFIHIISFFPIGACSFILVIVCTCFCCKNSLYKLRPVLLPCSLIPLVLFVLHEPLLLQVILNSLPCQYAGLCWTVLTHFYTEFGSALNIETLVAAAEKRDTPIEVFSCILTCQQLCIFEFSSHLMFSFISILNFKYVLQFHFYFCFCD